MSPEADQFGPAAAPMISDGGQGWTIQCFNQNNEKTAFYGN
ncbi:hypothetical protein [Sphingobium fuliginis]|jgi:hypothetical protein|nr:hypothetical protein [Sphingobium fuliginis]